MQLQKLNSIIYADSYTTRESNLQNYIQTIQPRLKEHPVGILIITLKLIIK